MRVVSRVFVVVVLAVVGTGVYLGTYGNLGSALYNGCFHPYTQLRPVGDGQPHLNGFPPRFVCLYRSKAGQIVERPD